MQKKVFLYYSHIHACFVIQHDGGVVEGGVACIESTTMALDDDEDLMADTDHPLSGGGGGGGGGEIANGSTTTTLNPNTLLGAGATIDSDGNHVIVISDRPDSNDDIDPVTGEVSSVFPLPHAFQPTTAITTASTTTANTATTTTPSLTPTTSTVNRNIDLRPLTTTTTTSTATAATTLAPLRTSRPQPLTTHRPSWTSSTTANHTLPTVNTVPPTASSHSFPQHFVGELIEPTAVYPNIPLSSTVVAIPLSPSPSLLPDELNPSPLPPGFVIEVEPDIRYGCSMCMRIN